MTKQKVDMARQEALEQENKILRDRLAEQEKSNIGNVEELGGHIASEIKKIRRKGQSSANTLTIVEKHDHKNISLWTKWGKRIGPLHPDNAIQTLNRFADIGIILSADQPTKEKLEAYMQTKEYKDMMKKESSRRELKEKSRRAGGMDKLISLMEKQYGLDKKQLNSVLKPSEMKAEGN